MRPAVASSLEISHQAPLGTQSSVGFVEFPQEALHLRTRAQSRLSRDPRASVMPVICAPFRGVPRGSLSCLPGNPGGVFSETTLTLVGQNQWVSIIS